MQPAQWVVQFNWCCTNGLILLPIDNIYLNIGTCHWIGIRNEKWQASRSGNKGNTRKKKMVLHLLVNNNLQQQRQMTRTEENAQCYGHQIDIGALTQWRTHSSSNCEVYLYYLPIWITTIFLVSSKVLLSYFLLYHAVTLIKFNVD